MFEKDAEEYAKKWIINEDDNGFYDAFSIGIRVNRCNFMLGIDQQVFNVSYKEYDTDY